MPQMSFFTLTRVKTRAAPNRRRSRWWSKVSLRCVSRLSIVLPKQLQLLVLLHLRALTMNPMKTMNLRRMHQRYVKLELPDMYSTLTFKKRSKHKKTPKRWQIPAPKRSQETADDDSAPGSPSSNDSSSSSEESGPDELAGVSERRLWRMFEDEVRISSLARRSR